MKTKLKTPAGVNEAVEKEMGYDPIKMLCSYRACWVVIYDECISLGMSTDGLSGIESVVAFIRHLAAQAKKKGKK